MISASGGLTTPSPFPPAYLTLPGLVPSAPSRLEPTSTPLKFCYVLPAKRCARYLGTAADYAAGLASYCEGVFLALGRHMRVCVAANTYTASDPFISALEMIVLEDSVCKGTDFRKYVMGLIARSSFGSAGSIIRYPDDRFDRYWQPVF